MSSILDHAPASATSPAAARTAEGVHPNYSGAITFAGKRGVYLYAVDPRRGTDLIVPDAAKLLAEYAAKNTLTAT